MTIEVRLLTRGEGAVLDEVAPDVFDHPIEPRWTAEFFAELRIPAQLAGASDVTTEWHLTGSE